MSTTALHHDVFISYARKDGREFAEKLDADLRASGFKAWRDMRDIDSAQDFTAEIELAIEGADAVAVCVTPDSKREDSFVRREIQYALAIGKPVVPLRVVEIVPHVHIVNYEWFDFFKDPREALTRLVGWLRHAVVGKSAEGSAPDSVLPPQAQDPYREYLQALYQQIVRYLEKTVFSLITLRGADTPDAVEKRHVQALPMAFFDLAGIAADQPQGFSDFHAAFHQHGGRVLLLGDPGAGKTTTLFAFARDAVSRRLSDPNAPLPLLAPISLWNAEQQTPLIDWLATSIPALTRQDIEQELAAGRALLLLDGLDELGAERENPQTKETYDPRVRFTELLFAPANAIMQQKQTQLVVSCRVKDYHDLTQHGGQKLPLSGAVTLQALDDVQMQAYLRELPQLWAALQKDAELREVARTPLLLSLFAFAFAEAGEELKKLEDLSEGDLRDAIFEQYVQRRYAHEERKYRVRGEQIPFALEEIYDVLGRVGIDTSVKSNLEISTEIIERHAGFEKTPDFTLFVLDLNLLTRRSDSDIQFVHLLLRDYFIFLKAVPLLKHQDWRISIQAVRALGKIHDPRALDQLLEVFESGNPYLRDTTAVVLGEIGDLRALPVLIEALYDTRMTVKRRAAIGLAKLGTGAIPALRNVLYSGSGVPQYEAAHALGLMQSDDTLRDALHTQETSIRGAAVYGLKTSIHLQRTASWADIFIATSFDDNARTRYDSAEALGYSQNPVAMSRLVELLKDETFALPVGYWNILHRMSAYLRICDAAAEALTRIGTPEALAAVEAWRASQQSQDTHGT